MLKPTNADALILAGGLGTRLRPAVGDRPKPIADVAGRPFIEKLLRQLEGHACERAILCVGYRAEQVEAALGNSFGRLALVYSGEVTPLGTAGALRQAVPLTVTPDVIVMNGDSYCELDLTAFAAAHHRCGAPVTMAVVQRQDRSSAGAIEIDPSGRIGRFDARPNDDAPGLINAGVYMFRRELLLSIPSGKPVSLEKEIFPSLAARGEVFGYVVTAGFIDIGTPATYAEAQHFFE